MLFRIHEMALKANLICLQLAKRYKFWTEIGYFDEPMNYINKFNTINKNFSGIYEFALVFTVSGSNRKLELNSYFSLSVLPTGYL